MEPARPRIVLDSYLRQKGRCQYCSVRLDSHNVTWEHIIPKSWGGREEQYNIVLACQKCNSAKSAIESQITNMLNRKGKLLGLDSQAALFMLRCQSIIRENLPKSRVRRSNRVYLRMALHVQESADFLIEDNPRRSRGFPQVPKLQGNDRELFLG